jgi:hypothetical protein
MDIERDTPTDIEVCLDRLLDRSPVERLVTFTTRYVAPQKPWKNEEVHLMLVTEQSAVRVLITWEQTKELISILPPQFGQYNPHKDEEEEYEHEPEPRPKKRNKRTRVG